MFDLNWNGIGAITTRAEQSRGIKSPVKQIILIHLQGSSGCCKVACLPLSYLRTLESFELGRIPRSLGTDL